MHQTVAHHIGAILSQYNVDTIFGVTGIPITDLIDTLPATIRFIGFRNEQSASYAASIYAYLTDRPSLLITVSGPGLIHSLAGVYNSLSNKWPLIVLSSNNSYHYNGSFQDLDQLTLVSPIVHYKALINVTNINTVFHAAFNSTTNVSYLDLPSTLISAPYRDTTVIPLSSTHKTLLPKDSFLEIKQFLQSDKNILLVIGKGATCASKELRQLVDTWNVPFLPTPMAKGIVPDSHPLNVSSARSHALRNADIIFVFAARLNWILHFGAPPKWKADAVFIQIDNDPNAITQPTALQGDVQLITRQLLQMYADFHHPQGMPQLWRHIEQQNKLKLASKEQQPTDSTQLTYHQVYATLRPLIDDKSSILVMEGANTMDIARISFPTDYPKHRLDAGTTGTMGIGLGYAIAAKLAQPHKNCILIQGDSAFGFSAMELETAARYKLNIIVIIMNNSGIYHGSDESYYDPGANRFQLPATALSQNCRYDIMAAGLGCNSYFVNTKQELITSFQKALQTKDKPTVLNVIIDKGRASRIQFGWQRNSHL